MTFLYLHHLMMKIKIPHYQMIMWKTFLLNFKILFVGKDKFDKLGFVFLILIVVKGKFVVRIYTIKSYETMTHRCRGHH